MNSSGKNKSNSVQPVFISQSSLQTWNLQKFKHALINRLKSKNLMIPQTYGTLAEICNKLLANSSKRSCDFSDPEQSSAEVGCSFILSELKYTN